MVHPGWVSGCGVSPGLNGRHDLNSQTYLCPSLGCLEQGVWVLG